ncbi:MAG: PAS domain S-box protein, partial [Proteobacteria bacterium]
MHFDYLKILSAEKICSRVDSYIRQPVLVAIVMSAKFETPVEPRSLTMGAHLFESSPDCVKLLSDDGRVLAMNRNGLCAMEIDHFPNVEGAIWKSFWSPESHDALETAIADATSGSTGHFTGFCPTAKGSPRWWDVIVTQFVEPESGIRKLLAVSRDITESQNSQRQLKASEARLRSLVSATSAILWNCPATGFFEDEQPDWERFTGQTFDEYQHEGWLSAVHPDDRDAAIVAWNYACRTLAPFELQHRLLRADGEYRHMNVKGVPIFDAEGEFTEWVGIHSDVTTEINAAAERERLLREIRSANDRINDVFREAPAFMCVLTGPEHVFE